MLAKFTSFSQKRGRIAGLSPAMASGTGRNFLPSLEQRAKTCLWSMLFYPWFLTQRATVTYQHSLDFFYLVLSLSSAFLETVCKQCLRNRLTFIDHIQYYWCPQPLANLQFSMQALTEKKTRFKQEVFLKCSGLGGFFSSLKKQIITLPAALLMTSAECLGTFASF